MGRVVIVGSLNVDSVVEVERHPLPGETLMGSDLKKLWGGKGANQAIAAARAGAQVSFIGRVGDDADGQAYKDRMAAHGIDVTAILVTPGSATGHAMIAVGAGDIMLAPVESDPDVIAEAVRRAHARGAQVILNLAPFTVLPADVLALPDPVVVNEHEAELLSQTGIVPDSLLITLGGEGARWGDTVVPAGKVTGIVDTTGAGDCFCGTLAARLAAGDSREDAMTAAAAAAALSVGWVGAQAD
jgi:ribokinase